MAMTQKSVYPSLREALTIVFRRQRAITLSLLIPPLLAVGVALFITPLYQSDSKVLIKAGREFLPGSDESRSSPNAPSSTMQEAINSEIEILTSRDLTLEVLSQVGIDNVYPKLANPGFSLSEVISGIKKA